ncbi:MAG: sigma-70 family RNA polymerase sigma factor [Gammaproteobacteria bacterium]|nr:sigma-70 family RNA polymerase sigma factor [Gammaproteobacteria bacterium]
MSEKQPLLKDSDIQADNPQHFESLVKRHQSSVFAFLGRMGFSQSQAEDIAQEAFLKAWRALKSYSADRAAFSTWLFTIVRNTALSEIAKNRRRPLRYDTDTVEQVCEETESADAVEQHQLRTRLQHSLNALSVDDRDVLALAYSQELNSTEAASVLGCAPGTYRTRLTRAKQRLRKIWEANDE